MTKVQRLRLALATGVVSWFTVWATLGYFVGIRGVGREWLAFWAVGGMSLIPVVFLAAIVFVLLKVVPWIEKGKS